MHTCVNDFIDVARALIGCPGSPTSDGIATVNPASISRRPKSATSGVMPGISCTTTTPGPVPPRYTGRVTPSNVNVGLGETLECVSHGGD